MRWSLHTRRGRPRRATSISWRAVLSLKLVKHFSKSFGFSMQEFLFIFIWTALTLLLHFHQFDVDNSFLFLDDFNLFSMVRRSIRISSSSLRVLIFNNLKYRLIKLNSFALVIEFKINVFALLFDKFFKILSYIFLSLFTNLINNNSLLNTFHFFHFVSHHFLLL